MRNTTCTLLILAMAVCSLPSTNLHFIDPGTSQGLRELLAYSAEPIKQRYRDLLQHGADIIETDLPREVGKLLYDEAPIPASKAKLLKKSRFPP